MSWKALGWAWSQEMPATIKMTLLAIADCHNEETGRCDPSLAYIGKKAGLGRSSVSASLKSLKDAGLIRIAQNKREDGSLTSSSYSLTMDRIHQADGGSPGNGQGQSSQWTGVVHQVDGGSPASGLQEPGIEPGKEPGEKPPFIPPLAQKRDTQITESFRAAMRQRFSSPLGATVDERIDEALGHKARLKYTDLQQYVQGWLRRDAERVSATGPPGNGFSNRSRRQTIHERMMEVERATPPLRQPIRP